MKELKVVFTDEEWDIICHGALEMAWRYAVSADKAIDVHNKQYYRNLNKAGLSAYKKLIDNSIHGEGGVNNG